MLPEIVSPALTLGPSGCDPALYRGSIGSGLLWPHSFFVLRGRLLLFLHTPPAPLALLSQWTILCSRRSLESWLVLTVWAVLNLVCLEWESRRQIWRVTYKRFLNIILQYMKWAAIMLGLRWGIAYQQRNVKFEMYILWFDPVNCNCDSILGVLFCPWSIHGFNEAHCTGMFNCKFRSCKEGSLKQQENKPIALSYSLCRYFVHSYQDRPKRDCVCGLHQAPYLRK